MAYQRLTCYFHSGTGNTYQAARWLMQAAAEQGIAASLIPITEARPKEDLQAGPHQLVGIYHPTHGLMPTWSMIKFLLRLPWGQGAHAFAVPTRGAYPLGRWIVPGGAGLGLFFPLLILLLKGYRVRGGRGIDLPANLINLHWGFSPKNVRHVMEWGRRRHARLVERILAGKPYWHPGNLLWELLWCIPFVIWPILPLAYLLIGRVFMAKLMFSHPKCVGCGRCARNCPSQGVVMVGAKPKTPFWTRDCEVCLRCMGYCKFQAVQASHLWIVPVIFVTSFFTAAMVQAVINSLTGLELGYLGPAYEVMAILLTYLALPLFYYVFWGLQRIGWLHWLFTYTTFTKLYTRRYHAPGVSPKQMNRRSESTPAGPDNT